MNKKRSSKTLQIVANYVVELFPYFFVFYTVCFAISIFNESWRGLFYWPAFHIIALCLVLISFLSENVRNPIKLARKLYFFILERLTKKNILKIIFIVAVLAFAFYRNTSILDSTVIFYALVAILFLPDIRVSAGIVFVLLAICPVALVLKKDGLAESCAVYAYYFLIITVVSQIKEVFLNDRNNKVKKYS